MCSPVSYGWQASRRWRSKARINEYTMSHLISAAVLAFSLVQTASAPQTRGEQPAATQAKHTTVLFICPHGAAKSVLASAYF